MTPAVEIANTTKVCTKCGLEQPLAEFRVVNGRWHLCYCKQCEREQMVEYHHRHWGEYYRKHQDVRKQRTREFYRDILKPRNLGLYGACNSPEQVVYAQERRAQTKQLTGYTKTETQRAQSRQHYKLTRVKAITMYGGRCECCGEARYDMLTFDHKVPTQHGDKVKGVGLVYEVIKEYAKSGYPNDKYRLLCWNCNASRGHYGYCPHEVDYGVYEYPGKDIKLEMIAAYGGYCVLCGEGRWEFLTIDHVNGGGTRHRASVGSKLYNWLKRKEWPKDQYRLLCFNCNCSVKLNGWSNKQTHDNVTCERMV